MTGEQRRDAVLDYHDTASAGILRRGRRAFLAALLAKGEATADDVYTAVDLPAGVDPRCLGAAKRLEKSRRQVLNYIKQGKLEAEPVDGGRAYVIDREKLSTFRPPPMGNPKFSSKSS